MKKRIPTFDEHVNEGILQSFIDLFKKKPDVSTWTPPEFKIEATLKKILTDDGWTNLGRDEEGRLIGNNTKYGGNGLDVIETMRDEKKLNF
ncbi:MAG: hypothetical protein WC979_02550 [Candidatus Pacearchaeota archaeon]|jgi:hypothetical protein|nr:hypothetical protein [Clostridia bacterium]